MSTLPRAILFDLDGTIIRYRERQEQLLDIAEEFASLLSPLTPACVVEALEKEFAIFWSDPAQHKNWKIPLRDGRRHVFARTFKGLRDEGAPTEELAHRLADRFHERREREMTFFPGALETVDALRARGIRLALVTNGPSESQRKKIRYFDLAHRFDHIQIEEEHGAGKPEPSVYKNAMEKLGAAAQETWMVGDHIEFDVGAPQRLGIHGIWHDQFGTGIPSGAGVKPDRVIARIGELLL